jgi:tetratricopeptide (TPR) repeat protein
VRRLVIVLALVGAASTYAAADGSRADGMPRNPDRGNFWRSLISPHQDEIDLILHHARTTLGQAETGLYSDYDPTGLERARFYREVYGMLRHARRLAPDDLEVLRLLGQCADELGKTREAIDALTAAIALAGADRAGLEVTGRLGLIFQRLGKRDEAIRHLRLAQGPVLGGVPMSAHVLVHLSHALSARGQRAEAIDVLAEQLPSSAPYYSNELSLIGFALAVQYDRDEQAGAAFELIERMQTALQGQLATQVQSVLGGVRFASPADRHYYQALLYEVSGHYVEARAEWALYAAAGDLPYRRRALEHVAAIDQLRRAPTGEAGVPAPRPPRVRPRKVAP